MGAQGELQAILRAQRDGGPIDLLPEQPGIAQADALVGPNKVPTEFKGRGEVFADALAADNYVTKQIDAAQRQLKKTAVGDLEITLVQTKDGIPYAA